MNAHSTYFPKNNRSLNNSTKTQTEKFNDFAPKKKPDRKCTREIQTRTSPVLTFRNKMENISESFDKTAIPHADNVTFIPFNMKAKFRRVVSALYLSYDR